MALPDPPVVSQETLEALGRVSTATIASQLQRRGHRNAFFSQLTPLHPMKPMVGIAHTLRYVPERPDLPQLVGFNAQRAAIEALAPGEVLVIEARNEPDAGTIGDIFATRAQVLGCVGVVTDGALRDTPAIAALGLPVYRRSSHAATLGRLHTPLDHQVPIACAGVTVLPGDVIVGDGEGAVAVPAALAAEIAQASLDMETREEFALEMVRGGASPEGYFPLSDERRPEFEQWQDERGSNS